MGAGRWICVVRLRLDQLGAGSLGDRCPLDQEIVDRIRSRFIKTATIDLERRVAGYSGSDDARFNHVHRF
jgi:hypothetical protein